MAIMIGMAAVAAAGKLMAAHAQAQNAEAQEKAFNYNASQEKINANAVQAAASANEMAQRRDNAVKLSMDVARTGESAGGFTGTNVGALNQEGANLELSALNTRYQGTAQAYGLMSRATQDEYNAQIAKKNIGNAQRAGWIGAAGAVLSSVSSYYGAGAAGGGAAASSGSSGVVGANYSGWG
jgi:hypothetical protein